MKSIIQDKKECFECGSTNMLQEHHIFYGNAKRKLSEKDGLKVYLCWEHHLGTYGVHGREGNALNRRLKEKAEKAYMAYYNKTEDEFRERYGENYL